MVLLINGVLISYFCRMNEIDDQTIFSIYCIILKQIKGCPGQFKSDYKGCWTAFTKVVTRVAYIEKG